eukprot:Sspe_Gene.27282::Locus_11682_Transcript_1_3_Confidence_0.714_Length_425::g.27282::m.27282
MAILLIGVLSGPRGRYWGILSPVPPYCRQKEEVALELVVPVTSPPTPSPTVKAKRRFRLVTPIPESVQQQQAAAEAIAIPAIFQQFADAVINKRFPNRTHTTPDGTAIGFTCVR